MLEEHATKVSDQWSRDQKVKLARFTMSKKEVSLVAVGLLKVRFQAMYWNSLLFLDSQPPAIVTAILQGNTDEVADILKFDKDAAKATDADKRSPLHAAAFTGRADIAGKIVRNTFVFNELPLHFRYRTAYQRHGRRRQSQLQGQQLGHSSSQSL